MSLLTRFSKSRKQDSIPLVPRSAQSSSHTRTPARRSTWRHWLLSDSWAIEVLAAVVAAASLASIGAVLGVYNGRPATDWPHTIKLNTVLQILATLLKGSMLVAVCSCLSQLKWLHFRRQRRLGDFQTFDAASRGPLGAAQLLYRLKFWHLASIGSFVTLLALASDAFVQQSLSYPVRNVAQKNGVATVPYTQGYTQHGGAEGAAPYISPSMLAALYDGVFASNLTRSTSAVTPNCPTGNCTFPSFASMAVCSKCANVTSLLNHTYDPGTGLGSSDIWTLPNGQSIGNIETGYEAINMNASFASGVGSQALPLNSRALLPYSHQGAITNMTILIEGPSAWDCVLFFCAKSYEAGETLGAYTESVLDTFDEPQWRTLPYAGGPFAFDVPADSLTTIGAQNRTFELGADSEFVTLGTVGSTLSGSGGSDSGDVETFTSNVAEGFNNRISATVHPPDVVANVADALTNAMRTLSGQTVTGTAYATELHVRVEWPWLILPLVMIVLALVFLGLTVLQSKRSDVPYWRSSVLAVMEHGVTTTLAGHHGDASNDDTPVERAREKTSDLEQWADRLTVWLRGTGAYGKGRRGYQLVVLRDQAGTAGPRNQGEVF